MSQSKNVSKNFGSVSSPSQFSKSGSLSHTMVTTTPAPTALSTSATTVTASQVLAGVITQTPGSALTITLPAASTFVTAIPEVAVGDTFDFSVINLSSANIITIAVPGSGSLVGAAAVAVSTSARFRVRITAVGTAAYVLYRL